MRRGQTVKNQPTQVRSCCAIFPSYGTRSRHLNVSSELFDGALTSFNQYLSNFRRGGVCVERAHQLVQLLLVSFQKLLQRLHRLHSRQMRRLLLRDVYC